MINWKYKLKNLEVCFSYDAYDLAGALDKLEIKSSDVTLVTIAQGFHWLDFDKFVSMLTENLPSNTIFAPIGYSRPHVMNKEFLLDESLKECLCNPDIVLSEYDEKFTTYEKIINSLFEFLLPYFDFNRRVLEKFYQDLPFEDYFESREFKMFPEILETDWYRFQQFIFSISAYRICLEKNEDEIAAGTFDDPLVKLLRFVLETEGKLDLTNSSDFTSAEDAEVLKTIKFDILWNFFVHILSN